MGGYWSEWYGDRVTDTDYGRGVLDLDVRALVWTLLGRDNAGERERAISRYPGVWIIRSNVSIVVGGGGVQVSGGEEE